MRLAALVLAIAVGSSGQKVDKDLAELANTERAFSAETVKVGFRDGFIKFFADDGIGFGPHPERTKEVLQKRPTPTGPRTLIFQWAPMFGDISAAGDLGYTTGPVLYTDVSAKPKPPRHGMYFSVWGKQADGSWKVVVDMGISVPHAVARIDTEFTAANKVVRGNARPPTVDNYRQLDGALWDSIAKRNPSKGYRSWLDAQFRIHRNGMMPATDAKMLQPGMIAQTKFEFIDGKIARSNDLAFTYGKYSTVDEPVEESGYYVHVWRRDGTGKWKLVADVQNPLPKTEK
jgi:ketosteroid isomerase-like protein